MKFRAFLLVIIFSILFAGTISLGNYAKANQEQTQTQYQEADLKNGAQLYDNWLKITDAKPAGNHPLYPAEAKKSGKATWRCKECHGWDYIGDKGRYSKGSHFTGIRGVYQARSESPELLYIKLTDKSAMHDFAVYLTKSQLWDLVKFLRKGQAAIDPVINNKGQAKGDPSQGKVLYNTQCSSCHGLDGNLIDFKEKKEGIQGVGWLANDNPQESIHKIRWGHPGSNMPSMITDADLSDQETIDILTYSQSLEGRQ